MGVCSVLCKIVIVIFNIDYTVTGLAFLGLGAWLKIGNNNRGTEDSTLATGENILIAVGIVMLVTAIAGDLGSCYSRTSSLATFCVLLVILMVAQLALFIKREEVGQRLTEFYIHIYTIYITSDDPGIGVALRVIHYTLNCCGAVGIVGVEPTSHTCPAKSGFLDRFMSPCPYVMQDVFEAKPPVAMAIFYGNAVLLVLCLLCSVALCKLRSMAATPRYVHLTQSVVTLSGLQAYSHPYPIPMGGVVLTSMEPEPLVEA